MSTENDVNEAPEVTEITEETALSETPKPSAEEIPETLPEDASEETLEAASEEEEREKVEWPGTKGEGELRLHFFDIVGLPETLEGESDSRLRIILALIAEVQQLRVDNHDLKEAVQYMTLETFIQQGNGRGGSPNRRMPAAMYRFGQGS